MKKKFFIKTLGCKVNQYESDGIAAGLEDQGLVRAGKDEACDVCIINTCAVTSKAGMQSRQAIRKIIRDNPNAKIVVTGCHAQTDLKSIQEIDNIHQIVCHRDKTRIAGEILSGPGETDLRFKSADHSPLNQFHSFDKPVKGGMTRAYLKIQDGCDAFCTYCIVPHARGSSVSMPQAEVHRHLKNLGEDGFAEVILTGIHTGMYGRDLPAPTTLAGLLEKIDRDRSVHRVRLSSIEPNELDDRLLDLAGPGGILCEHFHIPLQSGDDAVLKRMKRPYSGGFFRDLILKIHEKLPHAGIGVDTLIGFPGETDAQFENTYSLLEALPISYLHVFPFSPRKRTPAFHFTPKVPDSEIKARCTRMRELSRQKREAFIRANLGRHLEGLVQHTEDGAFGKLKAITSNYLTVLVDNESGVKGKIVDLQCEQCDSNLNIFGKFLYT